jgi:hypothetical protein
MTGKRSGLRVSAGMWPGVSGGLLVSGIDDQADDDNRVGEA